MWQGRNAPSSSFGIARRFRCGATIEAHAETSTYRGEVLADEIRSGDDVPWVSGAREGA